MGVTQFLENWKQAFFLHQVFKLSRHFDDSFRFIFPNNDFNTIARAFPGFLTVVLFSAGIAQSIAQTNSHPAGAEERTEAPGFSGASKAALSSQLSNAVIRGYLHQCSAIQTRAQRATNSDLRERSCALPSNQSVLDLRPKPP
jgi:hypothetical protein